MTKPQEDQSLVSIIVSAAIDRLAPRKTQKELVREMGFLKPGMLSMIKTGAARIPFTKLPNVAAALGIDPALLIRTHLCETWPEFEYVVQSSAMRGRKHDARQADLKPGTWQGLCAVDVRLQLPYK